MYVNRGGVNRGGVLMEVYHGRTASAGTEDGASTPVATASSTTAR